MDHFVTHQSVSKGVLTIMDTSYDKNVRITLNTFYHITLWSDPENICVYLCVVCVYLIKKYGILSMPLHLFHDDTNCRIDTNHIETIERMCRTIKVVAADIDLVKLVGMRHQARNTNKHKRLSEQSLAHEIYISNKVHDKCTYKGLTEGTVTLAWMPRGLLGRTSVHSTYSVTN